MTNKAWGKRIKHCKMNEHTKTKNTTVTKHEESFSGNTLHSNEFKWQNYTQMQKQKLILLWKIV